MISIKDKIEKQLLGVIESNPDKETLRILFSRPEHTAVKTFYNYTVDLISRLTLSKGRLKHYKTLAEQAKNFGDFNLSELSAKMGQLFEKYLRSLGLEQNTINSKMKIFIAIKNYAAGDKLVKRDCLGVIVRNCIAG